MIVVLFVVIKLSGNNSTPPAAEATAPESPSDTPNSLSDADVERLLKEAVDIESLEDRDGILYETDESDPYSGWVKSMYDSGQVYSLVLHADGQPNGPSRNWHENGKKRRDVPFKDGKFNGLMTVWHENGKKAQEGRCKDGVMTGITTNWSESGHRTQETNVIEEGTALVPRRAAFTGWYKNGQKATEGVLVNGKLHGLKTGWHENGQKFYEMLYKNGVGEGYVKLWHENGQKGAEGLFKDGILEGSMKYWTNQGEEVDTEEEAQLPPFVSD